jgi:hypothetical protein
MNITLLVDVYSNRRSSEHLHVDDRQSFLDACRSIDMALLNGSKLIVVLHNPAQIKWFDFYIDRIKICFYDPCREFAEILGTDESMLPVEVVQDPRFIISAGLPEKAKLFPLESPEQIESWILKHTLDPVWAYERIDTYDQLSSVLLYCIKRQNLKIHPTLQALRNKKIANWKESSDLKNIIKWLFNGDAQKNAESLIFSRLIWKYPHEIKLKALQYLNRWSNVSLLEDYHIIIPQIPLNDCLEITLPPEIRLVIDGYLNNLLTTSRLDSVVNLLSGITAEEIAIKNYLINNFDIIDETWNDSLLELNRIFSKNSKSQSFISYLQSLVPIRKPSSLLKTMSWEEVSDWLENDFFPYYRWCSALGKISFTESSIYSFEEWLACNYYDLTKTRAFSPYYVQPLIASKIVSSSVLHVIVDGLPWIYAQIYSGKAC